MTKKQDYRVVLTQKIFKKSLLHLLTEKPIAEITIKELCEEAGVNRGTFYSHYKDIYELVSQIEEEMYQDIKNRLSTLNFFNLGEKDLYTELFSFFRDNVDVCSVLVFGKNSDTSFVERILSMGRQVYVGIYTASGNTNFPVEMYYAFLAGGCMGLMTHWIQNGMRESAEEMGEVLDNMIKAGGDILKAKV